jgi:hypothetical protein
VIIGIGYKKQSGKDTFADMLLKLFKEQNIICCKDSFAEGLKQALMKLFPQVKRFHLYGTDDEKMMEIEGLKIPGRPYCCGRWLMQYFGTDVCRNIYSGIWANQLCERAMQQNGKVTITSDVRFRNEVKAIKENGGIIIKIERDSDVTDSHQSENDLKDYKDWDISIDNNSTLEELSVKAKKTFVNLLRTYNERN